MLSYGDMIKIINSMDVESIRKEAKGLIPSIRTLDTMSAKEKKNIRFVHGGNINEKDILVYLDTTLLCSGKKGIIFTSDEMIMDKSMNRSEGFGEKKTPLCIRYCDIKDHSIASNNNSYIVVIMLDGTRRVIYTEGYTAYVNSVIRKAVTDVYYIEGLKAYVNKDYKVAVEMWGNAANLGSIPAVENLCTYFCDVKKNYPEAYRCLDMAKKRGYVFDELKEYMGICVSKMLNEFEGLYKEYGKGEVLNKYMRERSEEGHAIFMLLYGLYAVDIDEWDKVVWINRGFQNNASVVASKYLCDKGLKKIFQSFNNDKLLKLFESEKEKISEAAKWFDNLIYVDIINQKIEDNKKEDYLQCVKVIKKMHDCNFVANRIYVYLKKQDIQNINNEKCRLPSELKTSYEFLKEHSSGNDYCKFMYFNLCESIGYGTNENEQISARSRLLGYAGAMEKLDMDLMTEKDLDICVSRLMSQEYDFLEYGEESISYDKCMEKLYECRMKMSKIKRSEIVDNYSRGYSSVERNCRCLHKLRKGDDKYKKYLGKFKKYIDEKNPMAEIYYVWHILKTPNDKMEMLCLALEQDMNIDFGYDFGKYIRMSFVNIIRYIAEGFMADKKADLHVGKNGSNYGIQGGFFESKTDSDIQKKGWELLIKLGNKRADVAVINSVLQIEDQLKALEKCENMLSDIQYHSIVSRAEALDIVKNGILYHDGDIRYPKRR